MKLIIALKYCLSSSKKGLNRDSNPAICNATPVLYQWSYQANIMWVNYESIDAELDGDNRGIMYLKCGVE